MNFRAVQVFFCFFARGILPNRIWRTKSYRICSPLTQIFEKTWFSFFLSVRCRGCTLRRTFSSLDSRSVRHMKRGVVKIAKPYHIQLFASILGIINWKSLHACQASDRERKLHRASLRCTCFSSQYLILSDYVRSKGGVCGDETKFILVRIFEGAWGNTARMTEPVVLVYVFHAGFFS